MANSSGINTYVRPIQSRSVYVVVGGLLVLLTLIFAAVGTVWTPYDPSAVDFLHRYAAPTPAHPFGTDGYGRDIFSRVMAGAWKSISLGLGSTAIALLISVPGALAAVYWPKRLGSFITTLADAFVAMPLLVFTLLVVVGIGVGHTQSIIAIGIGAAPRFFRVIRGAAVDAATQDYVIGARSRGDTALYIQYSEILPNIKSPIVVEASLFIGFAIMAGGALSYLGLGTQPPHADWGVMIKDGQQIIEKTWWPLITPSMAMLLAIVGFNFLGEGLRDDL